MADIWSTSQLQASLPIEDQGRVATKTNGFTDANEYGDLTQVVANVDEKTGGDGVEEIMTKYKETVKTAGWAKPEVYDYTTFSNDTRTFKWGSSAVVYSWDGEQGDLGPEYPELEAELFGAMADRDESTMAVDFAA